MEKLVLEGGALGALVYFGKLFFDYLKTRSTRSDEREKDMIKLQRETQQMQSNHMVHSTQAINDLTQVVGKNTQVQESSVKVQKSLVDAVSSCGLVRQAKGD